MNLDLQIIPYENWIKREVAEMFNIQYRFENNEFTDTFDKLYDHNFQKDKCYRVVALNNKKVVRFQSFFYWLYKYNSNVYDSYQSGNSIVHASKRGLGIFGKLLGYAHENKTKLGIDFFIGFPVKESYNSFIKKEWKNLFNLTWYLKPSSKLSIISAFNKNKLEKQLNNETFNSKVDTNYVSLKNSKQFQIYLSNYRNGIYLNYLY